MRAPTFSFLVLNFFSLICVTPALLPAPNLPRAEENNLTELAQSKPPTGSLAVSQNPKKAAFAAPTAMLLHTLCMHKLLARDMHRALHRARTFCTLLFIQVGVFYIQANEAWSLHLSSITQSVH